MKQAATTTSKSDAISLIPLNKQIHQKSVIGLIAFLLLMKPA